MACQGCGRISETRLCCPTCIEYGRTSFFCDQDCFTKNWNAHNQLHELLKRKRGLAVDGAASDGTGAPGHGTASGGGSSGSTANITSRPSAAVNSSSRGVPLPGGTSLVGRPSKPITGASATSRATVQNRVEGPGIFHSLVGHALSSLGALPTGAADQRRQHAKSQSPANRGSGGQGSNGRTRTKSPLQTRGQEAAPRARSFTVQLSLWALAIFSLTAGCLFYREHLRYVDEGLPSQADLLGNSQVLPRPDVAEDTSAAQRVVAAATVAQPEVQQGLESLRSEVAAMRDQLQQHEKMIRYILDRFVEKKINTSDLALGTASAAKHEAVLVNYSNPEFVSKSYAGNGTAEDLSVIANKGGTSALRKRKGINQDVQELKGLDR